MDARNRNALTQVVGGFALGSLLLYGGMSLVGTSLADTSVATLVTATLIGTMAAVWSLAHLDTSRAAPWVAFVLIGLACVAAFLGWLLFANLEGLLGVLLWINGVAGALTLILTAWVGMAGPAPAGTRRRGAQA